jgi:hypothetical protein
MPLFGLDAANAKEPPGHIFAVFFGGLLFKTGMD